MKSDTPRTDAKMGERRAICREYGFDFHASDFDFAKEMERENARLREALQPLASLRPTRVGNIPDCEHWLWKPSESNNHDLPGINVQHVKNARQALSTLS